MNGPRFTSLRNLDQYRRILPDTPRVRLRRRRLGGLRAVGGSLSGTLAPNAGIKASTTGSSVGYLKSLAASRPPRSRRAAPSVSLRQMMALIHVSTARPGVQKGTDGFPGRL